MTMSTRLGRLETATPPLRVIHLTASGEADLKEKFLEVLLATAPGPAMIDIGLAGVRSREHYLFLTHEERLELVTEGAGS